MPPQRLHDRYSSYVLQPARVPHDAKLIALLYGCGVRGTVFQILKHIPEQGEDLYTVLVDDRLVVEFEVSRTAEMETVGELCSSPLNVYRDELGQGKGRIRLDRATENARKLFRA
jgi:hypothetical protein